MPDSDQLNAIASTPIPGDQPGGQSIRYEESFAKLEAEVAKLENPAGGDIDWRMVEDGTTELLCGSSKDVLLAAWLARAMWHRGGLQGLATGLETLKGMLANFWDNLHPQRVRPRRAALEWLGEKLAAALTDEQLASDPAAIDRCVAAIDGIVAWAGSERFEGEDCGLMPLLIRLRNAARPAVAAEAEAAPSGDAGASPADAPAAGPGGRASGPLANRAQAVAQLKELAAWWAKHEPSSPMVPLLQRAVLWSDMDFPTLFSVLLRGRTDAKDYMWDVLGMNDQQPLA
ncbi:MAG: type VI secretion system ImpA family N-terminal domain-containing protein [Planctomycetes bacterium]|nr:type VI secretion system ImpA family N-terminal domain-containing protein [Planctomycetota bacterium]